MTTRIISTAWAMLAALSLVLQLFGYDTGHYVVGCVIMEKLNRIHNH